MRAVKTMRDKLADTQAVGHGVNIVAPGNDQPFVFVAGRIGVVDTVVNPFPHLIRQLKDFQRGPVAQMIRPPAGHGNAQGKPLEITHVMRVRLGQPLDRNQVILRFRGKIADRLRTFGQHVAKTASVSNIFDEAVNCFVVTPVKGAAGQLVVNQAALVQFHRPGNDCAHRRRIQAQVVNQIVERDHLIGRGNAQVGPQ